MKKKNEQILVFDNYDSFTYNLVHLVEKLVGYKVDVFRNDELALEEIEKYDRIILSPGPGIPEEAGMLLPLIKEYSNRKCILGVCLGHQAIAEAFGGKLINLETVYHGVSTPVKILLKEERSSMPTVNLFRGLPETLEVGRYHSWVVEDEGFPEVLQVTARDENNLIMALRHRELNVQGVQFHPESVLTPQGEKIIRNWLEIE